MDLRLRLLLWIPLFAYEGFLLTGGPKLASWGQMATLIFLGASMGFLLATMFTIRQRRREKLRLRH
ncbi:MAG TPA: hypothetical protein VK466_01965 [Terriglobales bacterium]|nr:hypothetical protein [Terriglobales bacterium]